jgi:hypothetical protein
MKQRSSNALAIAAAAAALVIVLGQPLRAEVLEGTKTVGGTTVYHKTVLPNGYDPAKAYPAVLAFGGGPQTMNTVDNILTSAQRLKSAVISFSLLRHRTASCSLRMVPAFSLNF